MKLVEDKIFDEERSFYGQKQLLVKNCKFDGPKDGESAFKECKDIEVSDSYFNLRYPFWHDDNLTINNLQMTENCRAALWYSNHITANNCIFHGIKAFRECSDVTINDSDIISKEFGWSTKGIVMKNSKVNSEYFMMRAENIEFSNISMEGKYSFQYIIDSSFDNCHFDTKDAFWHAKNVTVKNSTLKGEYLAWYSDSLTLINCKIIGTQPFCYCKNLKLIDCEMINTDLAFEKSEVDATIITKVDSIKNPLKGQIKVCGVDELIIDDDNAQAKVIITD